jgi:hypothetical protein
MLIPFRSEFDPEVQGEGSIDPLGLATLADRLADWIFPGITARMWRPRFLTAMTVASAIVESFGESLAKDGITPPWLIFEWYFVEPMARLGEEDINGQRIPGINKARDALRNKVPMNPRRYLKTPKVFGFHGVYKRLATHARLLDSRLMPNENGNQLLKIWEEEQGLVGFRDADKNQGDGPRLRRLFQEAIKSSLQSCQTEKPTSWPGAVLIVDHLAPMRIGNNEGSFLWKLLLDYGANLDGEVFAKLRDKQLLKAFAEHQSERDLLTNLRPRVSEELRHRFETIEAYENFCRPLQESFDRLQFLSSSRTPGLVRADDFHKDPRVAEIAGEITASIKDARRILVDSPIRDSFERLGQRFEDVRTGDDLFYALWDHHESIQKDKPPDGKRPWFESTTDKGIVVRPPYRINKNPPRRESYVHPYRLFAAASFIQDLTGAA